MTQLLVPIPDSQAKLGGIDRTTLWKLVKEGELACMEMSIPQH